MMLELVVKVTCFVMIDESSKQIIHPVVESCIELGIFPQETPHRFSSLNLWSVLNYLTLC